MPMQAIKVAKENAEKILASSDRIDEGDVSVMLEFVNHHERYFIDQLVFEDGDLKSWETVPADIFEAAFSFDKAKAETEFVPISRK